ncbi:MAG: 50S ribosomal protein L9 [Candidatus Caldatribacterium sp.]|uniref:50S ribosomal protein L9 n=1 Tax=Candidatus Caldatribacterium sp. TaxID=2282143 RepID=UPI002995B1FF|nr:50S ribosomal protein L9 [Candidatus Caldatribacterium sp.]MCX7730393.1 50S ribosomal protein L9 [Candidatus Caldatribacterium sp.]MDW8080712.1 50S ribosomal protein L9 [Candidatus Calescibacterium sp.]
MKVILLKSVENLGKEGDVVEVRRGYARNYLFPKKLAVEATSANLSQLEAIRRRRSRIEEKELAEAEALKKRLDGLVLEFFKKAGETGKLYGSLTSKEIADRVSQELQRELDKKCIELEEPIKDLGEHRVRVNLGHGITATLLVKIFPEGVERAER